MKEYFNKDKAYSYKTDKTIVTEVDKKINTFIINEIKKNIQPMLLMEKKKNMEKARILGFVILSMEQLCMLGKFPSLFSL